MSLLLTSSAEEGKKQEMPIGRRAMNGVKLPAITGRGISQGSEGGSWGACAGDEAEKESVC